MRVKIYYNSFFSRLGKPSYKSRPFGLPVSSRVITRQMVVSINILPLSEGKIVVLINSLPLSQAEMVVSSTPRYIPLVVTYKDVPILNPNNTAQSKKRGELVTRCVHPHRVLCANFQLLAFWRRDRRMKARW